LDYSSLEN